ncbi:MAG: hypothetical protein AB1546_04595 [bacterium]
MTNFTWGILGGVLAGVLVGTASYEVLNRYYPDLVKKTREKANDFVQAVEKAFREGCADEELAME